MKISKDLLKKLIKEESLKLINENQAFSGIYDKIDDVEDGFVAVNQKRFEQLKNSESKAKENEDYAELQNIRQEQSKVLTKLIKSFKKKTELYEELKNAIDSDGENIAFKGNKVFGDKELNEVNDETMTVGHILIIKSPTTETKLKKYSDGNNYQVVTTNIKGLQGGDFFVPKTELKTGNPCKVDIYRDIAGGPEYLKTLGFNTITNLIKNPS